MSAVETNTRSSSETVRLGLALSGGGFRSSLFHIGVLAQMAMRGLLRHVHAISTVSGGSIIGALYYLHVKNLLESTPDTKITDEHYKAIVENIQVSFLEAVQQNIRMRVLTDLEAIFKMPRPDYSRSDRIAELYHEFFYGPKQVGSQKVFPIRMRDLKIQPMGGKPGFYPRDDNAGREAKVPILLINATTLNTGRNWRFTASNMGEPPPTDPLAAEVSKKAIQLRPADSYANIVPHQQDLLLCEAVAASTAVPGIFHPLSISGLYWDSQAQRDLRVQLVDGGVHDNQGIQGLLYENCTHFIVSDASKQMEVDLDPGTDVASALARTENIFQDRLREQELLHLLHENQGKTRVAFMHLRKGLPVRTIAWLDQNHQPAAADQITFPGLSAETFGVDPIVQELLSRVRTDLDSFTDIEAYSLMLDGYLMSAPELSALRLSCPQLSQPVTVSPEAWNFLALKDWIKGPYRSSDLKSNPYLRQLIVAKESAFKVLRLLWPGPKSVLNVIAGVAALVLLALLVRWSWCTSVPLGGLLLAGLLLAVVYFARRSDPSSTILRSLRTFIDGIVFWAGGTFVWLFGWIAIKLTRFHLRHINPLFLRLGSVERFK
jgi:predicted acylesterase/phospholipase RssA